MQPHVLVLGLINESHIGMGRQLLASCITGEKDDRAQKLGLTRLINFGSLPLYGKNDVFELLDVMLQKGLLEYNTLSNNRFAKVLSLTEKGKNELMKPQLDLTFKRSYEGHYKNIEPVTEEDIKAFRSLGGFLTGLSDEQKKAVVCNNDKILCIAGAGSGKTRVLTRRVWYLAALKTVEPSKILAITFTRKARAEMIERLTKLMPGTTLSIETFNSFCEKILQKHEDVVYGKKVRVMDYKTKIRLIMKILSDIGVSPESILDSYYTNKKLYSSDKKTLFLSFINDMFSVMDYQRNNNISDEKLDSMLINHPVPRDIIRKIKEYKEKEGLRDYTDQIVHVIDYFEKHNNIPGYEHILVDEYQDINSLQFELINLLNAPNLFAVGDPRQSIYGWRGSRIDFILDFEINYPASKILQLNTNYRSTENIVDLCNSIIRPMKLPKLHSSAEKDEKVVLVKHADEDAECLFVSQSILSQDIKRKNIFVLARTNKQIEKMSEHLEQAGIKYIKRTIEELKEWNPTEEEVTLSTIHAIKGLEADAVYIIGAGAKNHPCKASEHPLLEDVKINEVYDKYAEELRLMYVALSRARKKLVINYNGTLSSFFDDDTFRMLKSNAKREEPKQYKINKGNPVLYEELKSFRWEESRKQGIPAYQVFSDRTLDELCEVLPTSFEELSEIGGFGPFKIRKWGSKIIKLILQNS
jgi:superfamily I DNA/RNA helicase